MIVFSSTTHKVAAHEGKHIYNNMLININKVFVYAVKGLFVLPFLLSGKSPVSFLL